MIWAHTFGIIQNRNLRESAYTMKPWEGISGQLVYQEVRNKKNFSACSIDFVYIVNKAYLIKNIICKFILILRHFSVVQLKLYSINDNSKTRYTLNTLQENFSTSFIYYILISKRLSPSYASDASRNIQNHKRRKQIASPIYTYKPRCDHMPQISYAPYMVHEQDSPNLDSLNNNVWQ